MFAISASILSEHGIPCYRVGPFLNLSGVKSKLHGQRICSRDDRNVNQMQGTFSMFHSLATQGLGHNSMQNFITVPSPAYVSPVPFWLAFPP